MEIVTFIGGVVIGCVGTLGFLALSRPPRDGES